jgi:hypothetical protein
VQWRDWNSGATQYGPGGTQLGSDYQYYGPRSGNYRSSPGYYEGESGPASGTQYGPDYGYYGPRSGSGSAYDSFAYSGGMSVGRDQGYCQQRFRSFDPASGTYMGFDGRRHPCP